MQFIECETKLSGNLVSDTFGQSFQYRLHYKTAFQLFTNKYFASFYFCALAKLPQDLYRGRNFSGTNFCILVMAQNIKNKPLFGF